MCKNNYIELIKFFLTKNVNVDGKNIFGYTPKDLTTNTEIKYLLDNYIKNKKINKTSGSLIKVNTPKNFENTKELKY